MLVLAVLGLLAVSVPADTSVRIPGTTLRFGLTDSTLSARGFAPADTITRKGRGRFFGLESEVLLEIEQGRLARARFTVTGASPYEVAYVSDQLTAMGYRPRCGTSTARASACDWTGRTRVHLAVDGAGLTAAVQPAGTGADAAAGPAARGAPADPGAGARALARLTGAGATAPAGLRAVPAIPPATTARPPADSTRSAATPPGSAPTLPETLTVEVAGRPSPRAAATVLSQSRCEYPAAARAAGIQGRVWVLVLVDTDGRVLDARVTRGIPELDDAARCTARLMRFAPRTWQGRPCRYRVLVPVAFTLH